MKRFSVDLSNAPRRFMRPLRVHHIGYLPDNWHDNERRNSNSIVFGLTLSCDDNLVKKNVNGNVISLRPPYCALSKPDETTRHLTSSHWEELYISYDLKLRPVIEGYGLKPGTRLEIEASAEIIRIVKEIIRLRDAVHVAGNADRLDLLAETLMIECFLNSTRGGNEDEKSIAIGKIASHVELHFLDSIDMEELVRKHGLSYRTFLRGWKKRFGVPPLEYVIRLKIATAQRYLSETSMSVEAIAEHLGYCYPLYFSRQFKRMTGLSPSTWRKRTAAEIAENVNKKTE